ncbi:myo-inositol 2-dehydrogenase [Novosphingobium sp. CF614]|uniref:inositol 2-dehydrogenase n=1 Tax=Novosphingobium sp. CF614 TaxID=1884364 RepID=UPI0008ECA39E|nr:inositol 2-dehydrogenase [Novosphingobium sp. CF614]SFG08063.1 myo-inositol 2-dehydrogenase [Novosphingobium sp. CF614]
MFKVAQFGAGRIGAIHARNIAAHPALSLEYVVDPIQESARALASTYGAKVASAEEVFANPQIDAVIVASSTDTHLDHCLAAARAGKAVWCEKPLDLDLDRLKARLADLEPIADRLLLGFQRRFDPTFRALHRRLNAGEIGEVETVHVTSHDPAPPPVSYIKVSGGIFKDMTIHDFDVARWILGGEIVSVFASASNLVDPAIGKAGDFDVAKVILRTAGGKICVISNTRRSGYGYDQRIEAYGQRGRLAANNMTETQVETWTEAGAAADRFENFFLTRYAQAYAAEANHFADILAGTAKPLAGIADGLGALELAVAAEQSARTGLPVPISSLG